MTTDLAEIMEDDQFLARVREALVPMLWDTAIPLIAQQGDALRQHGTGTLLRIAERRFLVSARHVFTDVAKVGAALFAHNKPRTQPTFLTLRGKLVHACSQGEDRIDLGILELQPADAQSLSNYRAITLAEIDQRQDTSDDLYLWAGYPCKMATAGKAGGRGIGLTRMFASTYPYRGAVSLEKYDPEQHILLDARRDYAEVVLGEGEQPDSLVGISGTSIWKTNATRVGRDKWEPSLVRVSAVQTAEYPKAGVLRGTMW